MILTTHIGVTWCCWATADPTWFTFTHLCILAVASTTSIRTIRYVTDTTYPSTIAYTVIWNVCVAIDTRRIADRCPTIPSRVTIVALTFLRWYTETINARGADSKGAEITCPTCVALADSRTLTKTIDTDGIADRRVAVITCPASMALATLTSCTLI